MAVEADALFCSFIINHVDICFFSFVLLAVAVINGLLLSTSLDLNVETDGFNRDDAVATNDDCPNIFVINFPALCQSDGRCYLGS